MLMKLTPILSKSLNIASLNITNVFSVATAPPAPELDRDQRRRLRRQQELAAMDPFAPPASPPTIEDLGTE